MYCSSISSPFLSFQAEDSSYEAVFCIPFYEPKMVLGPIFTHSSFWSSLSYPRSRLSQVRISRILYSCLNSNMWENVRLCNVR